MTLIQNEVVRKDDEVAIHEHLVGVPFVLSFV